MNLSIVVFILGWILVCEGALMLFPTVVALIYAEPAGWSFLLTAAICALLGILMTIRKPKNRMFYLREGFVITAFSWLLISIFGALPFLLTGAIRSPVDALFETVSGFTTTGASILSDVEVLPRSLLFWRSFTHWLGGMGVLVFLLTLLPLAGGGSYTNLMKAESPGPQVEKLVPKIRHTALILYGIYLGLTVIEIVILICSKMPVFDALTLSFGTAGTGGFGIRNDSIASYTAFQQDVIAVFMILFGVNFNFYFLMLLGKFKKAVMIEEIRWYFIIVFAAIAIITADIAASVGSVFQSFRQALFQVGAVITTTGYSTVDFDLWPNLSRTVLVMLMLVGACAGSTGGGIKVSRLMLAVKSVKRELHCVLHPQSVRIVSMDGKRVPDSVVQSTNLFFSCYVMVFAISMLLISLEGHDLVTNFTAVVATLNNIGPGLAMCGPTQNFGFFSDGSKLVMIFNMIAGRLELFPVLLLFSRETWRKF